MTNRQIVHMCLAVAAGACQKEDQPTETDPPPISTTAGDGDSGPGPGDGDGDPMTTAATSSDSSGSSAGGEETMGFVADKDIVAESECDPFAQDCPEGEKCVAYSTTDESWNANKCVMVMGDGQPGDPCMASTSTLEATDDCDANSYCWDVTAEGVGVCTAFCKGSPDSPICDDGLTCMIINEGSINLCVAACDPLLQNCEGETVCYWSISGFICVFAADEIPLGEPCGYINDCAPGGICLDATAVPGCAGAACCAEFCDLTEPICDAVPGTECAAFFEEGAEPPGYEHIGVCILPGA